LLLIKIYQYAISPLFPAKCRFYPSCSNYCFEAIQRFGLGKGLWLFAKRFVRCHPFSQGGIDPVPERFTFFKESKPNEQ